MSDAKTTAAEASPSTSPPRFTGSGNHNIQFITLVATGLLESSVGSSSEEVEKAEAVQQDLTNGTWFKSFLESLSSWLVGKEEETEREYEELSESESFPLHSDVPANESALVEDSFERLGKSHNLSVSTSSSMGIFPECETDPIWGQWEWILSKAEEFAMKRSEQGVQELSQLRERANKLRAKPQFAEQAKEVLIQQYQLVSPDDSEKLTYSVLDSSKRAKIIADVVNTFSPKWFRFIKNVFFSHLPPALWHAFEESYHESHYEKGLVGGLKEVGWQASHGPGNVGLTHTVLGDIIWSFWNTLISGIAAVLNRELTREEQNAIAVQVSECQGQLIVLWLNTVKQSMLGTSQAGIVVRRFAEEERRRKVRLDKIKKEGANAKYEFKPTVVLPSEKKPIEELRRMLESRLQFKV